MTAADVQSTFCATLVDEWIALGVRHAVVAPGSRSTPMAVALAARSEIALHVVHDERSAAFVALGLGLDGIASLVLCTSGTAAANFYPAVVEAGLSAVPLIVLTADRPDELRAVGAPQTIDQVELYGSHVRWFADPGVPTEVGRDGWRPLAATAVAFAADGPVQLNLAFREPLLGTAHALTDRTATVSDPPPAPTPLDPVPAGFDRQRGVILAGGRSGVDPGDVAELHALTAWPVLADPMSEMRGLAGAVTTAESLLRHERFAADHVPEVIVRIGRPATSKTLAQWCDRAVDEFGALLVQVGGPGRIDPGHNVRAVCSLADLIAQEPSGASGTTWPARWAHAEQQAERAIASTLDASAELNEPGVARVVAEHADTPVIVASSMPVRDFEWFGGARAVAHSNRGANGIDGVMSTALGVALGRGAATVVVGDIAFLHDANALVGLAARGADLRVVVVDNDGGGIFSFLPQAATLPPEQFELLFGTPHGADVVALAAAHGMPASTVTAPADLEAQLAVPGPWVVRIASDRSDNVAVHADLHAAVAEALG
ncbi:MAG: 2-succinyl-5-enolpyruvyl-6-hydroxy-3-cyclohexene-1-carboxylic-acid synthase [Ilumatobacter sp.]|nr:2-succinyl-5-enolpyruvyl-6-hydroxy-3-cyclohexene-1-carboxylic-acid synthase [Ilumatobacter sp.]